MHTVETVLCKTVKNGTPVKLISNHRLLVHLLVKQF